MDDLFNLNPTTTVIVIASAVVGLLLCLVICTCFCLYLFWRKNRKLEQEQDHSNRHTAKQPLHNSSDTLSRLSHKPDSSGHDIHTRGRGGEGTNDTNTGMTGSEPTERTPYSADETTSSEYNAHTGSTGKWQGFDPNFLVHPEQYLSASQGSNSGGKMAAILSTSGSDRDRGRGSSQHPQSHSNRGGHRSVIQYQSTAITRSGSGSVSKTTAQRMTRNLQRQRLAEIVKNARNALQLIESRIISLECEIGRGKFGKVFRGMWTDTASKEQKTVAVKWFKQDEVDEAVFEDFVKEIGTLYVHCSLFHHSMDTLH